MGKKNNTAISADQLRIAERRALVVRLYIQGHFQSEIAIRANVSQATVHRDIKATHARWQKDPLIDLTEAKLRELARINVVEYEAWQGWQRSTTAERRTKTITKGILTVKGERGKASFEQISPAQQEVQTTERDGDPRFLAVVLDCVKQRRAILGLDDAVQEDAQADVAVVVKVYADNLFDWIANGADSEHEGNGQANK